jgi:hypothetical protein
VALKKSKITKRVWYQGEWWNVEKVISPNKYDDFILLSRDSETEEHPRGIPVVRMCLIDAHNHEFYPDTKKVREWAEQQEQVADHIETLKYAVQDEWLDIFNG